MKKAKKYGRRARTNCVILHVDAGGVRDLRGWWDNPGSGPNGSHFQVAYDGTVFQYADTDYLTWTSGAGSQRSVGIETQGKAAGEWTPQQQAALVKLLQWLCSQYRIPARLMASSSVNESGIGYHRQGVPLRSGGTVSRTGGQVWAKDSSKVCPGPDRQAQVPGIVARVAGGTVPEEELSMGDIAKIENLLAQVLENQKTGDRDLAAHTTGTPLGQAVVSADSDRFPATLPHLRAAQSNIWGRIGEAIRLIRGVKDEVVGYRAPGRPDAFPVEVGHNKIKLGRLDLAEVHFKVEGDEAWHVARPRLGTWSRCPNEESWKSHNGVLDWLGWTGTPAVSTWSSIVGKPDADVRVKNPLAWGTETVWGFLEAEIADVELGEGVLPGSNEVVGG